MIRDAHTDSRRPDRTNRPNDKRTTDRHQSASRDDAAETERNGQSDVADGPQADHPLLELQRRYGNRSTRQVAERRLRPKLLVGDANDRYEREADRVAQTVRAGAAGRGIADEASSEAAGSRYIGAAVDGDVESYVRESRGDGRPLTPSVRSEMETQFGSDFGGVRLHTGRRAAAASDRTDARAFTVGRDIYFGAGRYQPATPDGRGLLAHELTHVVQQEGATETLRRVPEDAPAPSTPTSPEETTAGTRVSAENPPRAGLSVSINGLTFLPPEGTQFRQGSRARQGVEIALNRLVGEEAYSVELAAEFHQNAVRAGWGGVGSLAGEAVGGEEVTQFVIPTSDALHAIAWLEQVKEVPVLLSDSQRELLHLGAAATAAWNDLKLPDVAREIDASLPDWFDEGLFRSRISQNVGLLRTYIDTVTAYRADPTGANRQAVVNALSTIVMEFSFTADVLETIRADDALVDHWVYQLLWPTPRPENLPEDQEPTPAKAASDRPPNPTIASQFISFLHSQEALVAESWTESAARLELLDRFGRFLERSVTAGAKGDQQIQEQPGTANAPPIPAVMDVSPPLTGPPGGPQFEASSKSEYWFVMSIQFPDVYAAFQSYYFEWNYVRLPEDRPTASFDELDPQTPSTGDIAERRFGRATRYAVEDLETVVEELGPAGVAATSLVAANAILRYVGTGIGLGFEMLSTPKHDKNIGFPGPGAYLVRCKAVPYTGEKAEVVRPPSVAFYPVIVRDPAELAQRRSQEEAARAARDVQRMEELRELLSQPVSHLNERQLRQELDALERSLDSVGGALDVQRERLVEHRDSLPAGSSERERVQDQLDKLDLIREVRAERAEDRDTTGARPLVATFVSDRGESIRLTMEVVPAGIEDGRVTYWVSDLTTPRSSQAEGTGSDKAEAVVNAVEKILRGNAGYGRGYAAVQIDGTTYTIRIKASLESLFSEAVENVTMVLSLAAVAAAPFTGGSSLALLLPLGAVGAVPAGYRVVNRALDDTLRFDMATVMDIVNVVGGVAGVGHAATPLRLVNTGRVFYVMGLGSDGLGVLLIPADIASQIAALQGLPEGERAARMMEILGRAMLDAGISAGGPLTNRAQQHRMGSTTDVSGQHPPTRPQSDEPRSDVDPTAMPESGTPERRPERRPAEPEPARPPPAAAEAPARPGLQSDPISRPTHGGGHEVTLTSRGQLIRCSMLCQPLSARYGHVLEANPELARRLEAVEERAREVARQDDRHLAEQILEDVTALEADLHAAERQFARDRGLEDEDTIDRFQRLVEERTATAEGPGDESAVRGVEYDYAADLVERFELHPTRMDLDEVPMVWDSDLGGYVPMDISQRYPQQRGNLFNEEVIAELTRTSGGAPVHGEVYVETGLRTRNGRPVYVRADSWTPGSEIREHKHTQFSEISLDTALNYLTQLWSKYPPGAVVADVPSSRSRGIAGQPLSGKQVLIVPEQIAPIPREILEMAEGFDIEIRDINGHVYTR